MTEDTDIAMFLSTLNRGGAERAFINLSKGFTEANISVDLVLANAEGSLQKEVPPSVNIVDLNAPAFPPMYRHWGSFLHLIRYLDRKRPDAILSTVCPRNLMSVIANEIAGSPSKVIIRESNHLSKVIEQKIAWKPYFRMANHIYPRADHVIAVSHGVENDLTTNFGVPNSKLSTIYNPAMTRTIERKSKDPPDHDWFRSGSIPVILGVGSLQAQKDFTTLIDSFKQILSRCDARLMIIGDGPERESLQKMITRYGLQEKIELLGNRENPYKYMGSASVFVLSSRWEGCPNVLIEALACGTPVVSTDCPSGPREILKHGQYGHLVPVGDAEELASSIIDSIEMPLPSQLLKIRAADFCYTEVCDQYLDIIMGD